MDSYLPWACSNPFGQCNYGSIRTHNNIAVFGQVHVAPDVHPGIAQFTQADVQRKTLQVSGGPQCTATLNTITGYECECNTATQH